MSRTLLTNTFRLKKNTAIQNNVDDDLLNPYIFKSQETHIHQLLGTDLYNKLMLEVRANTITGHYKTLLDDFVTPCLIEWTFYEVMPFISMKITNKSIVRGNSDYSTEGDLQDLKYLRDSVRNLAEFYGSRLIGHLRQYQHLFPEYRSNSGLDKIIPNSKSYFGGVYLGNGSSKDDCEWGLGMSYKDKKRNN